MDGRSTSGVGPRGRSRNSATVQTAHCIPPWGAAPSRHRGDPTGRTDAELGLAAADVRCSVLGIPLPKPEGEAAQPGPPSGNPTLPSDYPTDKGLSAGKARGQTRPTRVAVPPTLCVAHPVPVRARRRAAPLPEASPWSLGVRVLGMPIITAASSRRRPNSWRCRRLGVWGIERAERTVPHKVQPLGLETRLALDSRPRGLGSEAGRKIGLSGRVSRAGRHCWKAVQDLSTA